MEDLWASLSLLAAAVLLCEAARRAAAPLLGGVCRIYFLETVSTFQLCCCTHELKLLGQTGRLGPTESAALTFTVTLVHLLTFRGATCNPSAVLESVCRGARGGRQAAVLVGFQFGAAAAARRFAAAAWCLGLSDMHLRHQRFGFRCFDPLGGTVLEAAAVEVACAFTVQAAVMHVHKLHETLRVPFIAAVITAVVHTGGGVSGAVFNPVLAFSVQFPCSGHSYLEYCFIYWLGPVLGTASCVLLVDKIVPFLSGRSSAVQKQKTQ